MNELHLAEGAGLLAVDAKQAQRFKRYKIDIHLIIPGERDKATAQALLPHVLERRCAAIPSALAVSRRLFDLYGAELTGESYTAGQNRVVTLGITGLKNEYVLADEDVAGEGLDLLLDLLFSPYTEKGVFAAEDVAIETAKQADHLRSEMNDKRSYCLRQARRKLYGKTPLGIESAGYLEDIPQMSPEMVYAAYTDLLQHAIIKVVVCGVDTALVAQKVTARLVQINRVLTRPMPLKAAEIMPAFATYSEAMDTVQGKLCILLANGKIPNAQQDTVLRMASAALGGLATSRLFQNVREKQSLCYYCTSVYGAFSGTLQMDSGVDHQNAERAAKAMLHELEVMQTELITEKEMENARLAIQNSLKAAGDSPDALTAWAFNEYLRGTNQTMLELAERLQQVTREQIRDALAEFKPCLQYTITGKEGA